MLEVRMYKEEPLDIEISGENINYFYSKIKEEINMEGIQLNNYKNKKIIEEICRKIICDLRELNHWIKEG